MVTHRTYSNIGKNQHSRPPRVDCVWFLHQPMLGTLILILLRRYSIGSKHRDSALKQQLEFLCAPLTHKSRLPFRLVAQISFLALGTKQRIFREFHCLHSQNSNGVHHQRWIFKESSTIFRPKVKTLAPFPSSNLGIKVFWYSNHVLLHEFSGE